MVRGGISTLTARTITEPIVTVRSPSTATARQDTDPECGANPSPGPA